MVIDGGREGRVGQGSYDWLSCHHHFFFESMSSSVGSWASARVIFSSGLHSLKFRLEALAYQPMTECVTWTAHIWWPNIVIFGS